MLVLNGTDYTLFIHAGVLAVILFVLQLGFCKYRHPAAKCIPIMLLALAAGFCFAVNKGWTDMSVIPFFVEHNVTSTQLWQSLALASVGIIAAWIIYAIWRLVINVIWGILHLIWLIFKFIIVAIYRLITGKPVFARPLLWPWQKPEAAEAAEESPLEEIPSPPAAPEEQPAAEALPQPEPVSAPEPEESPYEELLEEMPLEEAPAEEPAPAEEVPAEEQQEEAAV